MTPLGHAAVAVLAGRATRAPLALVAAAGVAPDVDFLFIAHPAFNAWHRVATHNLLFALAVAVLAWALGRRSPRVFAGALLAVLLHLFCDAILDGNPSNGIGIAPLWPFSRAMWSPFNLMEPWLAPQPAGWGDVGASLRTGMFSLLFELPFWAAALYVLLPSWVAAAHLRRHGRSR